MVERVALAAKLNIKGDAHMLRHGCGFNLANDGVDLDRSRPTWATVISRTPHATLRWRRIGLEAFGKTDGVW
jgi:hypothetical protein